MKNTEALNKWQAARKEQKENYIHKFAKEADAYKEKYSYRTGNKKEITVDDIEKSLIVKF